MEYLRSIHYISQALLEDVEHTTGMPSDLLLLSGWPICGPQI